MKKLFIAIVCSFLIFSCEDVIEVDLPTATPKLVIEASINWFEGTNGNTQQIKLTESAPYFNESVPPANNAIVTVTDGNNNTFTFTEEGNTGIYINTSFLPEINQTYTLTINYNEEIYTASETMQTVTPIDYIEQNNEGGFTGEDIEIKAFYTDPVDEDNYYFYEFVTDIAAIPNLEVYDDEFTNGNQIFAFFSEEDLETGDELIIRNYGVSERFYEYMFILLQQSGDNSGGPFETQPATVRGNCVNQTNPNNFPLGYFRVSQAFETIYIVE
ncbi:DUF4249 domain-containing protein [Lacinutrix salivirga]